MPTYKNLLFGIRKPVVFQIRTGQKSASSKMAGEFVGFCAFPRNNDLYQFMFQKRITVHIFKMPGKLPGILF